MLSLRIVRKEFSVYLFPHSLSAHLFITLTLYYTMYTHKTRPCGRRASKSDESFGNVFSVQAMKENDVKVSEATSQSNRKLRKHFSLLVDDRLLIFRDRLVYFENLDSRNCFVSHSSRLVSRRKCFSYDIIKLETRSNISWCKSEGRIGEEKQLLKEAEEIRGIDKFLIDGSFIFQFNRRRKAIFLKYVNPEWLASHDWEKLMSTNWKKKINRFLLFRCARFWCLMKHIHPTVYASPHEIHIWEWLSDWAITILTFVNWIIRRDQSWFANVVIL